TLQFLQQNAKERSESLNSTTATSYSLPQTSTKMSMLELDELRKKLGNVTASSNAPLPAEITRKMLREKHNKKNPTQPNPVFPNWVYDRPALIGDFITSPVPAGDQAVTIGTHGVDCHAYVCYLWCYCANSCLVFFLCLWPGTMPLPSQEQFVVEDLLFVLVGVDGRDIAAQPVLGRQNRSFIVDATLDMSIKELVNRILPVASYYSTITRFIEEKSSFEYGQVNHALTAAMRTLMKEYLILVTQLEHLQRQGLLSLQKLWFYIQPTMRTMEILASIDAKEVLYTLKERAYVEQIEKAYNYASKVLLDFLMDEKELIDLMPHDVITQLLRVLAIETKQEKAIINADPTDVALSGLEAFSFDYIVKWPLSLIINRFH
ncbi:hypothetical protein XENOCAPTIV_002555, partial [Xenoophorus captivus]